MSPKDAHDDAPHEGASTSPQGRSKGEHRGTQRDGTSSRGRDAVLGQIRQALGRDAATAVQPPAPPRSWRPRALEPDALVDRFVEKVLAVQATCARVGSLHDVPADVARYVAQWDLAPRLVVAEPLRALPWPTALPVRDGAAGSEDLTAVTLCAAGVAETGSLMLASSPRTPTTLNFVPDVCIAVLHAEAIVSNLEQALRRVAPAMPRAVNIITGPSRTADVEQVVEIGVHGPRQLHIILIDRP
ncbi:lactate utilization protein C [Bordetella genomosp. 13]|uniref:LutC/YkgG family protein n=1 Tax=Bordetella genomosp. 13 TaxID=463040 RepID=UPI0011A12310|nr:LUD domain-containing protein [Bordetella genomosp. 13]